MMHQALERVDSVQEQWPEPTQVRRRLTSQTTPLTRQLQDLDMLREDVFRALLAEAAGR